MEFGVALILTRKRKEEKQMETKKKREPPSALTFTHSKISSLVAISPFTILAII